MQNNNIFSLLEFHHIGLIVRDIKDAVEHYKSIFGEENVSDIFTVKSQNILECFVQNSKNSYLGLVSPLNKDSVIHNMMKKGITYYHIAYKCSNIESVINDLEQYNYKVINKFYSEAFNNNICAFLYTPEGALIELIEK